MVFQNSHSYINRKEERVSQTPSSASRAGVCLFEVEAQKPQASQDYKVRPCLKKRLVTTRTFETVGLYP